MDEREREGLNEWKPSFPPLFSPPLFLFILTDLTLAFFCVVQKFLLPSLAKKVVGLSFSLPSSTFSFPILDFQME